MQRSKHEPHGWFSQEFLILRRGVFWRLLSEFLIVGPLAVSVSGCSQAQPVGKESPDNKPFLLPTFSGESTSYHGVIARPPPTALPDPRALYEQALDCWPAESMFKAELAVEGRLRTDQAVTVEPSGLSSGGRASVALVARMPLYSAVEADREREREYMRRTKIADSVGALIVLISQRDKSLRALELHRALERRAQERVLHGVAPTSEQVAAMEKVATVEGELVAQTGQLQKARLELIGHCAAHRVNELDRAILAHIGPVQ